MKITWGKRIFYCDLWGYAAGGLLLTTVGSDTGVLIPLDRPIFMKTLGGVPNEIKRFVDSTFPSAAEETPEQYFARRNREVEEFKRSQTLEARGFWK